MARFFWGFIGALLFNISLTAIMLNMSMKQFSAPELLPIFLYDILASIGMAFVVYSFTKEESSIL